MKVTWKKLGLVFSTSNHRSKFPDIYDSHAQAPNAVDMGEFVRVYFTGRTKRDVGGNVKSIGLFVDLIPEQDFRVINIASEPIMELGGMGTFDEFGTYPISVLKDNEKFFAYYGGWSRCVSTPFDVSIGIATSENGESFSKLGPGPILSADRKDPFVITSPKIRRFNNEWVLTYTCGEKWITAAGRTEIVYKLKIAFSEDGLTWKRSGDPIIPAIIDADEAQACGDIYFDGVEFQMYFCYRGALDFRTNKENSYRIGYATSKDLLSWERKDSDLRFVGNDETWDSEMMAYPNIFDRRGTKYMLYLGNGTGEAGFGAAVLENNHD